MGFWTKISDWIYEITDPIDRTFKLAGKILFIIILVLFALLIAAGFLYVLYWIGKAILGFIKYYSQFA